MLSVQSGAVHKVWELCFFAQFHVGQQPFLRSASQNYKKHSFQLCDGPKKTEALRYSSKEQQDGELLQGPITFHCGIHTRIGRGCFFNFNLTVQDDADVTIVTPAHPMHTERDSMRRLPEVLGDAVISASSKTPDSNRQDAPDQDRWK